MLEQYPFVIPVSIGWLLVFVLPIYLVFYTSCGKTRRPICNRNFIMRCVSITLFMMAVVLFISGILQMFGFELRAANQTAGYWHSFIGFIFILAALNHIIIHIRDIKRYIMDRRKQKIE